MLQGLRLVGSEWCTAPDTWDPFLGARHFGQQQKTVGNVLGRKQWILGCLQGAAKDCGSLAGRNKGQWVIVRGSKGFWVA